MSRDGWSVVSSYLRSEEAGLLAELLRSSGIPALVEDAALSALNPLLQSAVGGAKVLVPASDEARAREIVASSGLFAPAGPVGEFEIPEEEWAAAAPPVPPRRAEVAGMTADPSEAREAQARHALAAALAAIALSMTVVVPLYALAAAVRFFRMPGATTPRARRRAGWALAAGSLALALAAAAWIVVIPALHEPSGAHDPVRPHPVRTSRRPFP